jgi:hypothetical protein
MSPSIRTPVLVLGLIAVLAFAPAVSAQIARGNIYGKASDETGAVLPGVTVTLSGTFGTRTTTTGAGGEFRFLNVDQGRHELLVTLTGFTTLKREVLVQTGQNVELEFVLTVAGVQETMVVTAETPVIDTKKVGTATVVSSEELGKIPSSRDPWALLRTVPGVIVDRVNIAGSESGQQSYYTAKGSDQKDSVWSIDGIVITDMAALGSSPGYYTYDTFDEINVATGGSSAATATGGLGINMVTRRGTNQFKGSFGGYFTHNDLQWGNVPSELRSDARLQGNDKADHTEQIADWSADFGGPILKDKLWFYGSYGRNDIRVVNLNQQRDKSVLANASAKLNWQATENDMVSAFWFSNSKEKIGRLGAFSGVGTYLDGTRWDQGNYYPRHPHGLSKLEWNHIFSPNFFLNTKGSYYSTGFSLEPQGGLEDSRWVLDNINRQARGTAQAVFYLRPQTTLQADASWFRDALGGSHEIRFGFGWRLVGGSSETTYPGNKARAAFNPTSTRARFYRDSFTDADGEYWSGYLADTFNKGRLTLNLGLRWDLQRSRNNESSIEGNPLIPNLLPGLSYQGSAGEWPVSWNTISPRAGLTYALDESHKTLVRASYAWYAGQLQNSYASVVNPVGAAFLEYDWRDLNGDETVQLGEVDFSRLRNSSGVDPQNPSAVGEDPDRFDPDLAANRDHEAIVGIDRELAPNLVVSAAYTWRRAYDLMPMQLMLPYWYPWVGIRSSDYARGETLCANGYCATPFVLNEAALERPDVTGGIYFTNRDGFAWNYNGVELSLVKRMSNKWMGRVALSWNNWTEDVEPAAVSLSTPTSLVTDPKIDGGIVVSYGAGTSGKTYYMNAKWSLNANMLYQLPAGFEIAANVFGRQGYPNPAYAVLDLGALDGFQNVLATSTEQDTQRFPDLWDVDLRLAKSFSFGERLRLTLSTEMFNVFNSNTEMNRINDFDSSAYRRLDEILAPRIVRFGARVSF